MVVRVCTVPRRRVEVSLVRKEEEEEKGGNGKTGTRGTPKQRGQFHDGLEKTFRRMYFLDHASLQQYSRNSHGGSSTKHVPGVAYGRCSTHTSL